MTAEWVSAWATVGSAVATAATGAVIAFQTVATRRSVQVAQELQVQAAKTRLDAHAPRVTCVATSLRWPPHHPATHDVSVSRGPAVSASEVFRLPRDANVLIMIEATYQLRNDGDTTLEVEVLPPLMPWPEELEEADACQTSISSSETLKVEQDRRRQRTMLQLATSILIIVPPSETRQLRLRHTSSVADLVAGLHMPSPFESAHLIIDDGFDEGVVDSLALAMRGHPLRAVAGETAGFTLAETTLIGEAPLVISPAAVARRYYLSKSGSNELPEGPRPKGR